MRVLLSLLLLLVCCPFALAGERINSFHSEIEVLLDGAMIVTETIRVQAEGEQIRQGIFRDFPTDYRDRFGNRYRVAFEVLEVRRNGIEEGYFSKPIDRGVRTYLGRKGNYLDPGVHVYELTYRTDRQLGFFADHDELYWNVTGNDWSFPIDRASARVLLPEHIPTEALQAEAYTGTRGSRGEDYRSEVDGEGAVRFTTTRALTPGEGLTIVVAWPKGYLLEPGVGERTMRLLVDNRIWLAAFAGLLLVAAYYLFAWLRVGRDPEAGVVIPRYEPPQSFSPGSARFIRRMDYDHKTFTAALVNLAVKGLLHIREQGDDFTLERTGRPAVELAAGEKALLKALFPRHVPGGENVRADAPVARLVLERRNHKQLRAALKAHEASLRRDYERRFFLTNRRWLIPGLVLSLAVYLLALLSLSGDRLTIGAFMSVWLAGWTAGVVMLLRRVRDAWRAAHGVKAAGALLITAFALPFVGGEVAGIYMLASQAAPALPILLLGTVGVSLLFYQLLKAPTRAGRLLLDQLDGFKLYLEVAEKDELALRHPPEKTPELFEAYLPYALALDVEQRWAERFADLLAGLQKRDDYRPAWYHGRHWQPGHPAGLAEALGSSLGSAVSSSSTAPGSSSGLGGGGSSGGGGGGGGGGGW